MSRIEMVIWTFRDFRETAEAAVLPQRGETIFPTSQDFVNICLVSHVPDDPVPSEVEYSMQCNRGFHDPQTGSQVTAGIGDRINHKCPDIQGQFLQLFPIEIGQVMWGLISDPECVSCRSPRQFIGAWPKPSRFYHTHGQIGRQELDTPRLNE